ncbi:hypothetical protein A7P89_01295 [Eikenella corrodens]|uniref:Uncharacterized protein n=1 Tax=Eikenella corrodens TaxID=539 RepID=A0A1A9RV48_EIKCO|nr:hypothetical protein [Eikenella corrodens]OAM24900.1 hypothetical protein A7P89_01295 [Eikenella corrodens]
MLRLSKKIVDAIKKLITLGLSESEIVKEIRRVFQIEIEDWSDDELIEEIREIALEMQALKNKTNTPKPRF